MGPFSWSFQITLSQSLEKIKNSLTGYKISETEQADLRLQLSNIPTWLIEIMTSYGLSGCSFSLGEEDDLSELGIEFK